MRILDKARELIKGEKLDKAKDLLKDTGDKLKDTGDKAKDLVKDKAPQIDKAIDKVADFADDKTKGKYSEKIESAAGKAKDVVDKIEGEGDSGSTASSS